MQAVTPSPAAATQSSFAASGLARRWRAAAGQLLVPATVLAAAMVVFAVPGVLRDGARGWVFAIQATFGPVISVSLLVSLLALVDAAALRGRVRNAALVGAAMTAAGLGMAIVLVVLIAVGIWAAPPWSTPVLWWANVGWVAMVLVGATLVHDYRVRGVQRATALREVRLRAAGAVRRAAEVRLQAMQARIDPRFLFDALSGVERVHDADPAAGHRLLDNLVAYLRAVVPDLGDTRSTVGRELDLARLWLEIRREVAGGTGGHDLGEPAADVRDRTFPAMTMIPLADAVLADAPPSATLLVRASGEGSLTTIQLECGQPAVGRAVEPPSVAAVRTRLRELYGERARLAFACDAGLGRRATVEIDLEAPDGSHR